ncbi:MAG: efflux RND transporter periplasmic adaptor subunit [Zavarzinia sp.]|nr:efflux RND transporter periplasmic adaptor subunit [Zavarzinia sp.]
MTIAAKRHPIVLAVGLVLGLAACDSGSAPPQAPGPMPVTVAAPLVRDMAEWDEFTGRFAAVDSVEIRARVSGYLDQIAFEDGQGVAAGQLLYVIDPRPFEAEMSRARADVESAQAALELSVREVNRYAALRQGGNASQQVLDERLQARRSAAASVDAAQAALRQAELNLSFTRIRSPIAGRISRTNVTVGNLVSGNAGGTELTTVVSTDPIRFYFDADEQVFIRYQRMMRSIERPDAGHAVPVEIGLADEAGYPHKGFLDFFDNQLDRATGTISVRASLPNPDRVLAPGMFGRIRVQAGDAAPVMLVPDIAIGTDQTRRFVWVVGDDHVPQMRTVEPGGPVGTLRIIRKGLSAGEKIVVNGIVRVRPGAPVTSIPAHLDEDGKIVPDQPPAAPAGQPAGKQG